MSVPLTIAGRSPFDSIRLRWGGFGVVALGVALMFQGNAAGVVFGVIGVLLGLATWAVTGFGSVHWSDLSPAARSVAGTGSIVGNGFLLVFFAAFFLVVWLITFITDNM